MKENRIKAYLTREMKKPVELIYKRFFVGKDNYGISVIHVCNRICTFGNNCTSYVKDFCCNNDDKHIGYYVTK